MSESGKRYYWLKLPEDFFGQKEIKHLRKIAGGDTFTIIYLKMLLKSLSEDGKLYFEGYGEDFAKELAIDIDEDAENVAITVNFLISKNILREVSVSEYEVMTAKEMVGSETDIARRVRKHRAAMAVLESTSPKMLHCNSGETKCNTEIDIEKDIEKESDIEVEVRKHSASRRFTPPSIDEVKSYCLERKNNVDAERFVDFYTANGWTQGKGKPIRDWKACVRTWERSGYNDKPKGKRVGPNGVALSDEPYEEIIPGFL